MITLNPAYDKFDNESLTKLHDYVTRTFQRYYFVMNNEEDEMEVFDDVDFNYEYFTAKTAPNNKRAVEGLMCRIMATDGRTAMIMFHDPTLTTEIQGLSAMYRIPDLTLGEKIAPDNPPE